MYSKSRRGTQTFWTSDKRFMVLLLFVPCSYKHTLILWNVYTFQTNRCFFTQIKLNKRKLGTKLGTNIAAVAISSAGCMCAWCLIALNFFRPPTRKISRSWAHPTRGCDVTHCIYLASRGALPIPFFRVSTAVFRVQCLERKYLSRDVLAGQHPIIIIAEFFCWQITVYYMHM